MFSSKTILFLSFDEIWQQQLNAIRLTIAPETARPYSFYSTNDPRVRVKISKLLLCIKSRDDCDSSVNGVIRSRWLKIIYPNIYLDNSILF